MIPYEHLVEAIGHLAEAISELDEMVHSIPKNAPKTVISASGVESIAKLVDDAHTLAATSLADIMYHNKHHDNNGNQ